MTFRVSPFGTGFILLVFGLGGSNPVGPRLVRGEPMPEKFLKSVYATEEDAKEALAAWEDYSNNHHHNAKHKATKRSGGPTA